MSMPKVHLRADEFAVLTLTEPWATLVVLGEKEWETRGWPTSYRGPLLIQASKNIPRAEQALCLTEPFESVLGRHGLLFGDRPEDLGFKTKRRLPFALGSIIGAVDLADTARTEKVRRALEAIPGPRAKNELAFGNYSDGRWAFRLAKPVRFAEPIPVRGALGIWKLTQPELQERVRAQLGVAA